MQNAGSGVDEPSVKVRADGSASLKEWRVIQIGRVAHYLPLIGIRGFTHRMTGVLRTYHENARTEEERRPRLWTVRLTSGAHLDPHAAARLHH